MSVNSPVEQAVAAVKAAQISPPDHSLSLAAAVVDASVGGWQSPPQSSSLRHFEPIGWGPVMSDAVASWSDPATTETLPLAVAQQQQQQQQSLPPHHEEFAFIDLFVANLDPSEGASSAGGVPVDSAMSKETKIDAFMKEAEAAGVFGIDDYLLPRGGAGGYGGPVDYA